jgi:hypothetical protein
VKKTLEMLSLVVAGATALPGCGAPKEPKPTTMIVETQAAQSVPAPPEIKAKINTEYMAKLSACTTEVVKKDAAAGGTYTLTFKVDKTGASSVVKLDGPLNEAIRACVDQSVKTWQFDPQLDKKKKPIVASFTIPFTFKQTMVAKPVAGEGMMDKINKDYMKDVQACQIAAAKKNQESGGALTIKFEVKADGTIGEHDATGIDSAVLTDCVKKKVSAWKLPPPTLNGQPTDHTFDITLNLQKVKVNIKKIRVP